MRIVNWLKSQSTLKKWEVGFYSTLVTTLLVCGTAAMHGVTVIATCSDISKEIAQENDEQHLQLLQVCTERNFLNFDPKLKLRIESSD